jgi:hypothetical protein
MDSIQPVSADTPFVISDSSGNGGIFGTDLNPAKPVSAANGAVAALVVSSASAWA